MYIHHEWQCCISVSMFCLFVTFLPSAIVSMIMIRTLRRDIARYNKEEDMVSCLLGELLVKIALAAS